MLTKENKEQIIKDFGRGNNDTGSSEVQIAILTAKIQYLTEHFKTHKKDFISRRGLIKMVGQRRRLLDYLKKTEREKYYSIIKKLNIRK